MIKRGRSPSPSVVPAPASAALEAAPSPGASYFGCPKCRHILIYIYIYIILTIKNIKIEINMLRGLFCEAEGGVPNGELLDVDETASTFQWLEHRNGLSRGLPRERLDP